MFKKTMKKIACLALATLSVGACASTFAGCETSHPEVEMQIEFNGETYTLEYKLYRKIAPSTVNHFLYLAENGYYDGLCVHDYDEDYLRMYTGAYSADETAEHGLEYKPYYETVATYDELKAYPTTVWFDKEQNNPSFTVYGEFENNNFKVTKGALASAYGSLSMYYHDISSYDEAEQRVYVKRADSEGEATGRSYKYNSTTSMFFISMQETGSVQSKYCTFATLENADVLKEFKTDFDAYIDANYGTDEDDFFAEESVEVCGDDALVGEHEVVVKYDVPKTPIVIKSVKVTKY